MNVTVIRKLHPNYRKRKPHVPVDEDAAKSAASAFGRMGGQARARKLTKQERSLAASKAARARWGNRLRHMVEAARKRQEVSAGEE